MLKRVALLGVLFSFFIVGCSNIDSKVSTELESTTEKFFKEINDLSDYTNESELEALNSYFTDDSAVKGDLIEYLTVYQLENEKEVPNYEVTKMEIKPQDDLYRVHVKYDMKSKETDQLLYSSDLNLYFKDVNGEMKIDTADYGG